MYRKSVESSANIKQKNDFVEAFHFYDSSIYVYPAYT